MLIAVSDDGVGFDPEGDLDGGFGLTGMRERVDLAGGELSVLPGIERRHRRPGAAAAGLTRAA